jgi:hypothetical protein
MQPDSCSVQGCCLLPLLDQVMEYVPTKGERLCEAKQCCLFNRKRCYATAPFCLLDSCTHMGGGGGSSTGADGNLTRDRKYVDKGLWDIWDLTYIKYLPACTVSSNIPQPKYCTLYYSFVKPTYAHVIYIKRQFFVCCYVFRRISAIFRESIYQYLKPTKI